MDIFSILLAFLFTAFAAAPRPGSKAFSAASASSSSLSRLENRQLLNDAYTRQCCESCTARYDYDTWWQTFDDLCRWMGGGQTLWTSETFNTNDWYCRPYWDANVCIHLGIKYMCGGHSFTPESESNPAGAVAVDYSGCIGYFEDTIQDNTCGGPTFPGARIISSDKCWIFQATADDSPYTKSAITVSQEGQHHRNDYDIGCGPIAGACPVATGSHDADLEDAFADAEFGPMVEIEVV